MRPTLGVRTITILTHTHTFHTHPPHPSTYDDALDALWGSTEARNFIDDVAMKGECWSQQQHQTVLTELFRLSGITQEMVSARLAALRAEAGDFAQLCPKDYFEQIQSKSGSPQEQRARPVLVRYVPSQADISDDMQVTDGSG